MVYYDLVKKFQFVKSIEAMLRSLSHLALPAKGINKNLKVWLDGTRQPLSMFSKII
jgi:hypothetical protein